MFTVMLAFSNINLIKKTTRSGRIRVTHYDCLVQLEEIILFTAINYNMILVFKEPLV